MRKRVEYLGYYISEDGITLSSRHTEAINKFPQPNNILQVQRFLGLTNYFRRFIKDYAEIARPLNNLLKKNKVFDFNPSCVETYETLKRNLINYPVLRIYNPTAETELHTDASAQTIAAILMQNQQTGAWSPQHTLVKRIIRQKVDIIVLN